MKNVSIQILTLLLVCSRLYGQDRDTIKQLEYNQSACDRSVDAHRIKPRIVSLSHHGDTLDIQIGFATTCCLEFIPKINCTQDTLTFSYDPKDEAEACACYCCYTFTHRLTGINSKKLTIKLYDKIIDLSEEKYKTYPVTYSIVNGDTINLTDKYGLKQGIWIQRNTSYTIYKNDKPHEFGRLYREFYKDGRLRKQCFEGPDGSFINCRHWKRNGQEIRP